MEEYSIKGIRFDFLDPDQSTLRETVPGNSYEPAVVHFLHDIFSKHKNGTFLDVGALYGFFSCFVAKISDDISVVAFEPSVRSASVMEENFKINSLTNAVVEKVALTSDKRDQAFLGKTLVKNEIKSSSDFVSTQTSYGESYKNRSNEKKKIGSSISFGAWCKYSLIHLFRSIGGWNKKEIVKCIPFDGNYEFDSEGPVVVKIDVHGAEISVLKGMRNYLKNNVDMLLLELHRDDMLVEGTHSDTVDILKFSGLTLYEIVNFRKDGKWSLKLLNQEDIDRLRTSRNWPIQDKAVMKMILGVKTGVINV